MAGFSACIRCACVDAQNHPQDAKNIDTDRFRNFVEAKIAFSILQ